MTVAKKLLQWRFQLAMPYGQHVWFDPEKERVEIHPLTETEKAVRIREYGKRERSEGEGERSLTDALLPFYQCPEAEGSLNDAEKI